MEEIEGKKTKRKQRRFTADFKASAVRLVLDEGRTIDAVVESLGLTRSAFCAWLRQARIDRGGGKRGELTSEERARLKQLEKENRELKEDKVILKKWVAFCAREKA
jgi:transposase